MPTSPTSNCTAAGLWDSCGDELWRMRTAGSATGCYSDQNASCLKRRLLAPLRHAVGIRECLLIGVDRK
jgi:hypothetical protein